MYSSRGSNNTYGQPSQSTHPAHPQTSQTAQPYASQSAYRQNLGSAYSGSSVGGPDGASQLSMASRHSSMLGGGGPHETADIGGAYRAHPSAAAHYGGQYSSVYGSAALNSTQQSGKGAASSALESRRGYSSAMPESPKFVSSDYVSSASHGYGQKGDQLYVDRISDYPSIDRRQYGERSSAYLGREQNEPTGRYADSLSFSHQHQTDLYDRLDQASVLRQEQMLKVQSLQSNPLDGGSRQADYLATRAAAIRHPAEDLMSYAGRVGADPRSITMLSGSSQGGQQHAPSILGAAPRSNVEDLLYVQSSSNPGYGVSLPPGRDYATGKGLHAASLESDYPGSLLSRGSLPRMDDRTDERGAYSRELERKEEERRRDRLREREKERDRDKERERDRDRERERERERQRRRERTPKRREKERDREPKHGSEVKRERSPPRLSRDRRGSSLSKEGRSLRRDSPRHDVSHRRHSPVKEKRREYVCKVFASNLVEVQRDYLSIDKRYPRLFVAPEVSKVVVNWPKENVKLSLHTPVSFEHDFVEDETAAEKSMLLTKSLDNGLSKAECGITLWNAKMILMSGLSQNALEELSSERSYDDRIPHYCNMLRFALLKKDNAFLAIGGPWDTIDGGDPSVDDSSLIRTVIRYAKALTGLDLTNCQRWNRFLEIHYDRIGKDGLFSHKEVTVLYVPDLSDCLPSLEIWREQWLAHKKEIAERESKLALRKEKGGQKKEGLKGKDSESVKDPKSDGKSVKKKSSESPGQALDVNIKEKDGKTLIGTAAVKVDDGNKKVEEKDAVKIEEGKELEKEHEENPVQTSGGTKSGKKRIVRKRIVKQKASDKSSVVDNSTVQSDMLEEKDVGENNPNSEVADQLLMPSAPTPPTVKTFTRKKVAKKVVTKAAQKAAQKGVEIVQPEVISVKEPEGSEGNSKGKLDDSVSAGLQDASAKTTVKKKIIKRVLKRKVSSLETSGVANESTEDVAKDVTRLTEAENEAKTMGEQTTDAGNQGKEVKSENKGMTKLKQASEKQDNANSSSKMEGKSVEAKKVKENSSISKKEMGDDEQLVTQKDGHAGRNDKSSEREKSKEENRRKEDGKDETRSKSNRDVKEMKKPEEPPRRPGLFLQTKGSKNLRLRSLSLSLDSLLDYTTNDIEESTFELSVFSETLYEMLQYQMGSRILSFLQKMRIKFVTKRNKRKRQLEESAKKGELLSPVKRVKTKESIVKVKPIKAEKQDESQKDLVESVKTKTKDESQADLVKTETKDESQADLEKAAVKEDGNAYIDEVMKAKSDDGTDEDEDPEEDQEEDEEMSEGSSQHESTKEEMDADNMNIEDVNNKNAESDDKPEKLQENEKDENKKSREETSDTKPKSEAESKKEAAKTETKKKETQVVVDKELLEAFRFFDRNRVGYIRVEDMRLILHSMGKFMSHRDVKELVQSALLESNTGRNDQILYDKLVTMSGI